MKKNGLEKRCIVCNKLFYIKKRRIATAKYCSRACRKIDKGVYKKCLICNNPFYVKRSLIPIAKYCSKKCWITGMKGKPTWNKGLKVVSYDKYHAKNMNMNGKTLNESRYIWSEHTNNSIPEGCIIHHKDFNHKNNSFDNLVLMKKGDHVRLHAQMWNLLRSLN
jgi:hypothetical protein